MNFDQRTEADVESATVRSRVDDLATACAILEAEYQELENDDLVDAFGALFDRGAVMLGAIGFYRLVNEKAG